MTISMRLVDVFILPQLFVNKVVTMVTVFPHKIAGRLLSNNIPERIYLIDKCLYKTLLSQLQIILRPSVTTKNQL